MGIGSERQETAAKNWRLLQMAGLVQNGWAMKATICLLFASLLASYPEIVHNGPDFSLHIDGVRSLGPEERIGFGKSLPLYAITGTGPQAKYTLYCVSLSPRAGQTYIARDEFVGPNYSALHLWPVEKKDIKIPPEMKPKGRLYRVITMVGAGNAAYPDLACDIYSENALRSSK